MKYQLIRSRRKTIGVEVTPDGRVVVRAPKNAPLSSVNWVLKMEAEWILDQLEKVYQARKDAELYSYQPGGFARLFGETVPVEVGEKVAFNGKALSVPDRPLATYREELAAWYWEQAEKAVLPRVESWAKTMGVKPRSVKISRAKKRWGSCSGENRLNFSWMLAFAPRRAVEYVIVHELCHILYHDHSAAFWEEVSRWMPDYREQKRVLTNLARQLELESW